MTELTLPQSRPEPCSEPPARPVSELRWWSHRPTLARVLSDLLAGELTQMRPGAVRRPLPWPDELDLVADLGADSLELLGLASTMEQLLAIGNIGEHRLLANPRLGAWLDAVEQGLGSGVDVIRFRTSGSSGAPKTCTHAYAELWQETAELAALFPESRRIVSLVPSHHIYGFLFTVLLPRALGLARDAVLDLRGASPGEVARQLRPGDLVVGFPDFWQAFGAAAHALPERVLGVTSTAPCPDAVARAVLASGIARLVQVYGSSETAGVGWRDCADVDYQLFPYWRRSEAGDGDADVVTLMRTCADGRRSAYPLQDRLVWSAPGRFRPGGRIDHAVQVGGTNVFPGYVADVLRMHPDVEDATVRLMRPDEGTRLKAFVVARGGVPAQAAGMRTDLTAWIAERLAVPERPAAYSFGPGLPRQANGKPADWIIEAWD